MKPRLLIADDHELVRHGLRRVLDEHPQWELVGEATDGREALALALELRPDVAIVDYSMPRLNGLEVTRQLRAERPETQVLVLTMHHSEQLVREVLAAGARGYVLKSDAGRLLSAGVEALLSGKPFFTPAVSELLLRDFLDPSTHVGETPRSETLTAREHEVLRLVAEGQSTKELAAELGISAKTAETHRSNIMRKLGARSVADMVRYAIRNHIIEA